MVYFCVISMDVRHCFIQTYITLSTKVPSRPYHASVSTI